MVETVEVFFFNLLLFYILVNHFCSGIIDIHGTEGVRIEGVVSANGNAVTGNNGGGAGGSIKVHSSHIDGHGLISVIGGNGGMKSKYDFVISKV